MCAKNRSSDFVGVETWFALWFACEPDIMPVLFTFCVSGYASLFDNESDSLQDFDKVRIGIGGPDREHAIAAKSGKSRAEPPGTIEAVIFDFHEAVGTIVNVEQDCIETIGAVEKGAE